MKKETNARAESKTEPLKHNENFVRSLDELSKEDIPVLAEKQKKGRMKKVSGFLQNVLIVVCAVVFVVCAVMIARNLIDKKRGNDIYNDASGYIDPITVSNNRKDEDSGDSVIMKLYDRISAFIGGEDLGTANEVYDLDLAAVKASLSALKEKNPDVVGWIYVEDSRINYPLMRSSSGNDDYYLTHAYTGEYLAVGSIYMVSDCDVKLDNNPNTLIYGHNVVNGSMFHDVTKFLDAEFFENSLIYIYTLDGAYIYKPFSIYQTTSDYNYIQTRFWSESEFLSFATQMKANSQNESDVSVGSSDTMITLSTCTNGGVQGTGRYALHAKLIAFAE